MWVTLDDLYVFAAQNAIGDQQLHQTERLTDTLLGYIFLKNQSTDSMWDNRDTSCKTCVTEKWACMKLQTLCCSSSCGQRTTQMLPTKPLNILFSTIM